DDDGVVARGGAHADRCMAAAVDRHAIAAGTRANRRAAAALRLAAHHGPAAVRLACRRAAALRIASRCRAAVAVAGTALLARAHAGPHCASCACASWTRPAAGSAETGAATAMTAAAPRIIASVRIFFS